MRVNVVLVAGMLCVVGEWQPALAQHVPIATLPPVAGRLAEEFAGITSVRELGDGRVIIADPADRGLVVADFRTGSVEPIGRKGKGPGEYAAARRVIALSGDSSLVMDGGNRRWLVLHGAAIVATAAADDPSVAATRGSAAGADTRGNLFLTVRSRPTPLGSGRTGSGDSAAAVLVSRRTGAADTVARLRLPATRFTATSSADGRTKSIQRYSHPLAVGEEAVLFSDGWLAVARLDPYRVDWRAPGGSWTRGAPLPIVPVKLNRREKETLMERTAAENDQPVASPDVLMDWPEVIPPFASNSLVGSSDGRLLIRHEKSADHPETTYDVVNRAGVLERQLRMPGNLQIVGFGATSVYVTARDDDGIQRLQRHAWPAPPRRTP